MKELDLSKAITSYQKGNVEIYFFEDLYYSLILPKTECTLADIQFIFTTYTEYYKNIPKLIIAEMGEYSSMNKEAREFLETQQTKALCEAVVIHGLAQRLLISFYHSIKKHSNPSKVFKTKELAFKWAMTFS